MFKNFLLKKILRTQGVPEAQVDMFISMMEKNPELFKTIAEEVKAKMDGGMDQMTASTEVMKKYEEEFKEAVTALKTQTINHMVFGDIFLLDQINWVERVCNDIGITAVEPLWNNNPQDLVSEFVNLGFEAVIVSCQAEKLGKEFIGRKIDKKLTAELKEKGVCPCGENGEFHTLVVDGPIFKRKIEILESEPVLKEGFWKHWFLDIKNYK